MSILDLSSQVTFLYFEKLGEARKFFDEVLELEVVYDPKWACVWRTMDKAYIGAVDADSGSIEVETRGGVLISLTVKNIEEAYEKLKKQNLSDISKIRTIEDIGLKSFFFTGPEGYKFEIQQFTSVELQGVF